MWNKSDRKIIMWKKAKKKREVLSETTNHQMVTIIHYIFFSGDTFTNRLYTVYLLYIIHVLVSVQYLPDATPTKRNTWPDKSLQFNPLFDNIRENCQRSLIIGVRYPVLGRNAFFFIGSKLGRVPSKIKERETSKSPYLWVTRTEFSRSSY